jgi:deoxyribonuclease-4
MQEAQSSQAQAASDHPNGRQTHASKNSTRQQKTPPARPVDSRANDIRIGIHTSIAGDVSRSLDFARLLGANCLQIFSSSPRMWSGENRIAPADAGRFRENRRQLALGPLVIHCNYLINMGSPDPVLRARSVQGFHGEIIRAIALGADYLVMHPGASCGEDHGRAITAIAEGIHQASRGLTFGGLSVLLENTAGQGTSVGSRFEELRALLDLCSDQPIAVCLDTAHLFAAGHDIRTASGIDRVLELVHAIVGLDRVRVVHMNDSKSALGSHVDRHEHIGKGQIGTAAFGVLLNHPLLEGRAFILETPIDRPGDDRRNLQALWKLAGVNRRTLPGARDGFTMFRGPGGSQKKAAPNRKKSKADTGGKRAVHARKRGGN